MGEGAGGGEWEEKGRGGRWGAASPSTGEACRCSAQVCIPTGKASGSSSSRAAAAAKAMATQDVPGSHASQGSSECPLHSGSHICLTILGLSPFEVFPGQGLLGCLVTRAHICYHWTAPKTVLDHWIHIFLPFQVMYASLFTPETFQPIDNHFLLTCKLKKKKEKNANVY